MRFTGADIKDGKMRGEWAELRFMARASEEGLSVSKPWGDSRAYDFIIEHRGKLLRVQVKSTTHARYHSYVCNFHGHKNRRYTASQIDFVAAYIVPKDVWFIFPISVIMKVHSSMVLSPHMKVSKYGEYQEAWCLMRGEDDSTLEGRCGQGIALAMPKNIRTDLPARLEVVLFPVRGNEKTAKRPEANKQRASLL